jgi:hypothetical protein
MSRTQTFRIEIEFEDKIVSDNEIMEIANNIGEALSNHVNNSENGLTPKESETFTKYIRVTPQFLNTPIHVHFD